MNVKSPLFRKLLAASFLTVCTAIVVLDFFLTRFVEEQEVQHAESQLIAQANLLTAELQRVPPEHLSSWTREAGKRALTRVTIIAPDGTVLADSEKDPEGMENHADRPEVKEALISSRGRSIRHSATLNLDLCYVAVPVRYRGKPGHIVRLALPLENLNEAIATVRRRVLGTSAAVALAALLAAWIISRSMTGRIRELQNFADGLVKSRLSETLPPAPQDEIGALSRSLNSMAVQLRDLVSRLTLESERRAAILSSMIEGVLAVDADMRVTFTNLAFCKLIGAAHPVPEKMPLLELVRDPGLKDVLRVTADTGESRRVRLQLPAADGRSFQVQAAPLGSDSSRGAIAILHDISDLERLERVRRDFVANVSHELRTPLTAIRGYAETLLEGALDDTGNNRRFVQIIQSHAIRLNSIASDLLTLSELESGRVQLEFEEVPLSSVLESALRSVESEARLRDVKISGSVDGSARVRGDKTRVEQVLVNLLDNAIKFNRRGGNVAVDVTPAESGLTRIRVTDTGIGIPSSDLPRIFERFYRVDRARSREVGGTGLGLAIVRHIVERLGGSVVVESQLGKGSTFTVTLPAA